jgi:hypothetical protein
MTNVSHRALRTLVVILGLDATAKGLIMIFGGKALMMRLFPHPPESEITTLLLLMRQESGALDLAMGLMLYFAYRDPPRNVAILNAIAVGLCIAAVASVVSLYTLDASKLYPAPTVWGHSLVRLGVAALLFYLRPGKATSSRA